MNDSKKNPEDLLGKNDFQDGAQSADDAYDSEEARKVKGELTVKFPGLAMANKVVKDDQEIELDMDELNDELEKPKSAEKIMTDRRKRERSRSLSVSSDDSRRRKRRRRRESSSQERHHRGSRRRHRRDSSSSSSDRSKGNRKNRRRSKSPGVRNHRRNRSDSRSNSPRDRHRSSNLDRNESQIHKVIKVGSIYRGVVQKVIDFGLFVKVNVGSSKDRKSDNHEGLVHIS